MDLRLPPMQALRAFEAAARSGSLTGAAASLNLTHGAISHQIKALEADLGVRLVERAGRGIRLTDEGQRFAARVRTAFAELAAAVREMTDHANPRRLRVSVLPSFGARWLLPRMAGFLAAHPDIDLDVRANVALADFDRDDIDVAIRYGYGEWEGLVAEFLFGEVMFPVCSPRYANGRPPSRPADLARHTLLRSDTEPWRPWFAAAGLDWPEPARGPMFNDSSHLLQAAAEGQGIALARSTLAGNDLAAGAVVRLFDVALPAPRKYFLVYPPRLRNARKVTAFLQWLRDEASASPGLPSSASPRGRPRRRG
jgi:LysR family glycine cleavage system transcriptional activator